MMPASHWKFLSWSLWGLEVSSYKQGITASPKLHGSKSKRRETPLFVPEDDSMCGPVLSFSLHQLFLLGRHSPSLLQMLLLFRGTRHRLCDCILEKSMKALHSPIIFLRQLRFLSSLCISLETQDDQVLSTQIVTLLGNL